MPFVSKKQQRYMYANKPKGVDLDKWAKETDFSKLPEKKSSQQKLASAFRKGFEKEAYVMPGQLPAELPKNVGVGGEELSSGDIAKRVEEFEKKKRKQQEKSAAIRSVGLGGYINKRIKQLATEQRQSIGQLLGKTKLYKASTKIK